MLKIIKSIVFLILIFCFLIAYAKEPLKEGENLLKLGQYLQAKEYFKKFLEHPQLAPHALIGISKSEYNLGNYPETTLYLKRLLRDFKDSPFINEGNLYMGLSYLKMGKYRDAEFYLKKVEPPLHSKANIGLGWVAFYKGDLKTVESIINTIDKKEFNENTDAALLRIKYLANTGKADEALKEFERNVKLKKINFELDKAEVLIKAGKIQEAERLLKNFLKKDIKIIDSIKAKNMLFNIHLLQGKKEEALKIAKEIYLYNPSDDLKLKLASLYNEQKNYDESIKILLSLRDKAVRNQKLEEFIKNVIKENPEKASEYIIRTYPFLSADSHLLIDFAQFLKSQGKFKEAKTILQKVMTGPRKSEAMIPLAQILIKEGKLNEAKKILEPIKNNKPLAMALYAQILDKEGDKNAALIYVRKSISKIKDPEIILFAGDLEYSVGNKKTALKHWIEAAKLGNSQGALKAADYFYISKDSKQAIAYYKRAIDLGLNDNDSLMWAYYQYGKLTKDKSYLEKVVNSKGELSQAAKELLEKL